MHETPSALRIHPTGQREPNVIRIRIAGSLFLVGDFLGLFFNPENESGIFLLNVGNFYRHILWDSIDHSRRYDNFRSKTVIVYSVQIRNADRIIKDMLYSIIIKL
jgi:hypothetical protein